MGGGRRAGAQNSQPTQTTVAQVAVEAPPAAGAGPTPEAGLGGMVGGFAVASAEPAPQEDQPSQGPVAAMGGMLYAGAGDNLPRVAGPSNEPNDSNDKSTDPK